MQKMNTKIIIAMLICCIGISTAIGAISRVVGTNIIQTEASDKLVYMAKSNAEKLNTKPVFKDNILVGVIGFDFEFDDIIEAINDIKVYDTGYAALYNEVFSYSKNLFSATEET
jgi:hypothetical protein